MSTIFKHTDLQKYKAIIDSFSNQRILCVGDVVLDRFIYGTVSRMSSEAPVPVLVEDHRKVMLGCAGNAAANIASLGGSVFLVSTIGQDSEAQDIKAIARQALGHDLGLVTDPSKPTTVKTRLLAKTTQIGRFDQEIKTEISEDALDKVKSIIKEQIKNNDAVLLCDYGNGFLTEDLAQYVIKLANDHGIPTLVDPRGKNLNKYDGVTILKPNRNELSDLTDLPTKKDAEIKQAANKILNTTAIKNVLVTKSEDGMSFFEKDGNAIHIPTQAKDVYDVSGAGDTVAATLILSVSAKATYEQAIHLGNIAGGIVVGRVGTARIFQEELIDAVASHSSQGSNGKGLSLSGLMKLNKKNECLEKVSLWRTQGYTVGFTNGYFDLLHPGHLSLFEQAKEQCDKLIVAVNSDKSAKESGRIDTLVQNEVARTALLGTLETVDLVVSFDEKTPADLLKEIKPDFVIKGNNYKADDIEELDAIEDCGSTLFFAEIDEEYGKKVYDAVNRNNVKKAG